MQTLIVASILFGALVLGGCQSVTPQAEKSMLPKPKSEAKAAKISAVGKQVQKVITDAKGLRLQFFTLDDKELKSLPEKTAGSVSIHAADGSGQDNYRFDATGKINRHMRSAGTNYAAGVWETLP